MQKRNISLFIVIALFSSAGFAQSSLNNVSSSSDGDRKFSLAQQVEIESRDQLARQIADNVAADAMKRQDPLWLIRLMSSLYALPSASLRAIQMQARSLDQAHEMAIASRNDYQAQSTGHAKALGDPSADLVFTPKTPCRFIDTRNVGGVIPKGSTAFKVFDTFQTGPTYGGDPGCTLPGLGEIAIAANITVTVDSGAAGFLGIRPLGSTSRTSLVNWPTGGTTGVANAAIITTAQDSTSHHYEFEAYAGGNTPNLILDYFGYFEPAAATALDCVSVVNSVSVPTGGDDGFPAPACTSGYSNTQVACLVLDGTSGLVVLGPQLNPSNGGGCEFHNPTASSQQAQVSSRCCRVP